MSKSPLKIKIKTPAEIEPLKSPSRHAPQTTANQGTRFLQNHVTFGPSTPPVLKIRSGSAEGSETTDQGLKIITKNQHRLGKIKRQYDQVYYDDGITYSQFLSNQMYEPSKGLYSNREVRPRAVTAMSLKEPVVLQPEVD